MQQLTLGLIELVSPLHGFMQFPGVSMNIDFGGLRGGVSKDVAYSEDGQGCGEVGTGGVAHPVGACSAQSGSTHPQWRKPKTQAPSLQQ